jgi:hypothetical protein
MRIIIIEDHLMFHEVVRRACEESDHGVMTDAGDGSHNGERVAQLSPGLCVQ